MFPSPLTTRAPLCLHTLIRPCSSPSFALTTTMGSFPIFAVKKSPTFRTDASVPTQNHVLPKISSNSRLYHSSEMYASRGRVDAHSTGFLTNAISRSSNARVISGDPEECSVDNCYEE